MTTKLPASIADLKQVLEAALLTANQPLSLDDMTRLFVERVERTSLRMLLDELKQDWASRSMELVQVATGYRFQARAEYAPFLARLNPERQLAYKQPVTRGDIEQIRGVTMNPTIMRQLQERDWIDVVGQRDVPGRPSLYATTKHFLDDFNILSLTELPAMADFAQQEIAFPNDDEVFIKT
jgi:segregation and condensation protein B